MLATDSLLLFYSNNIRHRLAVLYFWEAVTLFSLVFSDRWEFVILFAGSDGTKWTNGKQFSYTALIPIITSPIPLMHSGGKWALQWFCVAFRTNEPTLYCWRTIPIRFELLILNIWNPQNGYSEGVRCSRKYCFELNNETQTTGRYSHKHCPATNDGDSMIKAFILRHVLCRFTFIWIFHRYVGVSCQLVYPSAMFYFTKSLLNT